MPTVKVRNLKNKEVGDVELLDAVFGVELNEPLIHSAVMNYQANGRQGTSATKTRGNVSGSGRKLWKQKGTGRARIASLRSPLWKGGGNVHGPQPRDWSYQMPKKMRRGAIRSALSERLREGNLIVIDEFEFKNPKTAEFVSAIGALKLSDDKKKQVKILIVDSLDNENLILSARNVEKTKVTNSFGLNIYDIIYHEKLLISKAAIDELNQLLDPKREGSKEVEGSEAKPEDPKAKEEATPKAAKGQRKPKAALDNPAVAESAQTDQGPANEGGPGPVSNVEAGAAAAEVAAEESVASEDAPVEKQSAKETKSSDSASKAKKSVKSAVDKTEVKVAPDDASPEVRPEKEATDNE